jgi:hypothetical protein
LKSFDGLLAESVTEHLVQKKYKEDKDADKLAKDHDKQTKDLNNTNRRDHGPPHIGGRGVGRFGQGKFDGRGALGRLGAGRGTSSKFKVVENQPNGIPNPVTNPGVAPVTDNDPTNNTVKADP